MHLTFYVLVTPRSATATTVDIKGKFSKTRVRPTSCRIVVWRPKYFCYTEQYTRYNKLYQMKPSYVDKVISIRVLLLFRVGYTELNIFAIPSMSHRFFPSIFFACVIWTVRLSHLQCLWLDIDVTPIEPSHTLAGVCFC